MHDENQAVPPVPILPGPQADPPNESSASIAAFAPIEIEPPFDPPSRTDDRGLAIWLLALLVCGVGGLLLGMQELAGLAALAGMFVAAQAADVDERWESLYYLISWVVPVAGAAIALGVAFAIVRGDLSGHLRTLTVGMAVAAAGISMLTLLRPISDPLTRTLFRGFEPSHTLRLGARLVLLTFTLAIPGWFALREVMDLVFDDASPLLEHVSLGGELIGYAVLAFASIGFLVRRDPRTSLERLGIRPIPAGHIAIIAIGVVTLWVLNSGADWIERTFLHDLWVRDQQFNQSLASNLGPARVLLLGLSAGIGEEITLRGALQPKLGLMPTSLLFGALHVQYSWYGIIVICLLGLTLGAIRAKASTATAMAVHAVYDIIAVFSI